MAIGSRTLEVAGVPGSGRLARVRQWWEQEHVFGYSLIWSPTRSGWRSTSASRTAIRLGLMSPPGPNWLGMSNYAMAAVIIVNVWRGLPFLAISVLAGLVSIPREFYEAAEVDSASVWGRFRYVTLPQTRGIEPVTSAAGP